MRGQSTQPPFPPDRAERLRNLADHVSDLTAQLAICVSKAIELGSEPPSALIIAERTLWRWTHHLRTTATPASTPAAPPYLVAVLLQVEIDGPFDPGLLADTLAGTVIDRVRGSARRWRIRQASVHPTIHAAVASQYQPEGGPDA